MVTIGFKNFRKFENFPSLELGNITLLVGSNNSGKSTFVKSILTLDDYFKNSTNGFGIFFENGLKNETIKDFLSNQHFRFNGNYLAHIGTFKRALYNKASDKTISFRLYDKLSYLDIEIEGDPENEESVYGKIKTITIANPVYGFTMLCNLKNDIATINITNSFKDDLEYLKNEECYKKLYSFCAFYKHDFHKHFKLSEIYEPFGIGPSPTFVSGLIQSFEKLFGHLARTYDHLNQKGKVKDIFIESKRKTSINFSKEEAEFLSSYKENILENEELTQVFFNENIQPFHRDYNFPIGKIYELNIEYVYAHSVNQSVIYSAKDSNDYLSRTIHDFVPVQGHTYKRDFIIEWMTEFEIGQDFTITSVGGEAYIVLVTNMNGEKVYLADLGMGSIRLMILLFRLAITIPNKRTKIQSGDVSLLAPNNKVFIIEEPEQNLHPNLQSKLAVLFYKLNKDYGFRFIVETHSEYLIRKSQVIVGKENYVSEEELREKNPFRVYFFNKENKHTPYIHMKYRRNGLFDRPFGEGFYDEAGNSQLQLMKIERDKKNV